MSQILLRIFQDVRALTVIWLAPIDYFGDQGRWPASIRIGRRQAGQLFRPGADVAILRLEPGGPNPVPIVAIDDTLLRGDFAIDT
jgi:hypothetical protein